MLHHGLYEQVINNQLNSELAEIPEARKAVAPIDKAEASKVLSQYLTEVVQKGLDNVVDNGGDITAQIALTNQVVELIQKITKEADFAALGVDRRAEQLLALLQESILGLRLAPDNLNFPGPYRCNANRNISNNADSEDNVGICVVVCRCNHLHLSLLILCLHF